MLSRLKQRITRSAAARLRHYASVAQKRAQQDEFANLQIPSAIEIPTWTAIGQRETLYQIACTLPKNATIVEIGSYLGATTCFLAAAAAKIGGKVIAVDMWNNETMPDGQRDTWDEFRKNTSGVASFVKTVRKRTADLEPADVEPPVHLAFIDADHSYEATKADAAFVAPLIAPDGLIAFHDTTAFAGVGLALAELLASQQWCLAGHLDNLTWIRRAAWSPWPPDPTSKQGQG
jgi:predicted O-methyltransferase YrrM